MSSKKHARAESTISDESTVTKSARTTQSIELQHTAQPQTAEAMMDDLRTDLCELGFMELIDYVVEFLRYKDTNAMVIKSLNRMWRFIAMMAAHWEGAIFCKCGKHMLLNPTKLQKPNAEKDAWCCDVENCGDFCTCNIPKCLKNDDELQEQRIGGYPAFEFLGIDFSVCHENEVGRDVIDVWTQHRPDIHNVYFDSWPLDDVVAIRFLRGCFSSKDKDINNKLLECFGPRNLRLFVAANALISPTSLEKCGKLSWLDFVNAQDGVDDRVATAAFKLPHLRRLSVRGCSRIRPAIFASLRNTSIETLVLGATATDALLGEDSHMMSLKAISVDTSDNLSSAALATFVRNASSRLEELDVGARRWLTSNNEAVVAIASAKSLRKLRLDQNFVTDWGLQAIASHLKQLEYLKFACGPLTNEMISAIGRMTSLNFLTFEQVGSNVATPQTFNAALENLTQLRSLDASSSLLLDTERSKFLEKLVHLEVLILQWCSDIDDETLALLQPLTKLRKLDLSFCSAVTCDGISHLSGLTEMESLNLSGTCIADEGLLYTSGMTKMRWLNLSSCGFITDKGLQFLHSMRDLERLNVKLSPKLTTQGVVGCVERMCKLKSVHVGASTGTYILCDPSDFFNM